MVVPDSVKEKVGELPDISGMSKVRTVNPLKLASNLIFGEFFYRNLRE